MNESTQLTDQQTTDTAMAVTNLHYPEVDYMLESIARMDHALNACLQATMLVIEDESLKQYINNIFTNNARVAAAQRQNMHRRLLDGQTLLAGSNTVPPIPQPANPLTLAHARLWTGLFSSLIGEHPELVSLQSLEDLNNVPAEDIVNGVYAYQAGAERKALAVVRVTHPDSLVTVTLDGTAIAAQTRWDFNGAWLEHSDITLVDADHFHASMLTLFNELTDQLDVESDAIQELKERLAETPQMEINVFARLREDETGIELYCPPINDAQGSEYALSFESSESNGLSEKALAYIALAAITIQDQSVAEDHEEIHPVMAGNGHDPNPEETLQAMSDIENNQEQPQTEQQAPAPEAEAPAAPVNPEAAEVAPVEDAPVETAPYTDEVIDGGEAAAEQTEPAEGQDAQAQS